MTLLSQSMSRCDRCCRLAGSAGPGSGNSNESHLQHGPGDPSQERSTDTRDRSALWRPLACRGRRQAESIALAALSPGLSGPGVLARVIAPAMHWIGELCEQSVITIADVHVATAIR